jgi:hypothetical protein
MDGSHFREEGAIRESPAAENTHSPQPALGLRLTGRCVETPSANRWCLEAHDTPISLSGASVFSLPSFVPSFLRRTLREPCPCCEHSARLLEVK